MAEFKKYKTVVFADKLEKSFSSAENSDDDQLWDDFWDLTESKEDDQIQSLLERQNRSPIDKTALLASRNLVRHFLYHSQCFVFIIQHNFRII